jgi:hypothetical protein
VEWITLLLQGPGPRSRTFYEVKATSTLSLTDSKALNEANITPTVLVTLQKGPSIAVCTFGAPFWELIGTAKNDPLHTKVRRDVVFMCTHLGGSAKGNMPRPAYLNTPFLYTEDGFETEDRANRGRWRDLATPQGDVS